MKKTLIFAPETINLAETTRMLEIAKELRADYCCLFVGYSDEYSWMITEAGFEFTLLNPVLTQEKIEHLWKVDRMESFADPFTEHELRKRVLGEIQILRDSKAEAVVMGFTLSFAISARVMKVPLICVMPFPLTEPFLRHNLASVPDEFYRGMIRIFPEKLFRNLINKWLLNTRLWMKPFRTISKEYDIKPLIKLVDLYQGDYNLITDIPELTGVDDLPENWFYVGFIYAKLKMEIPLILNLIPRDKPLIYCAMGSSVNKDILKVVLESFEGIECYVITPMKKYIESMKNLKIPSNVYVTDLLPAHLVNPLADIAVIHGGQGTVQTAIASATPFIGIGLQPEQEANIDLAVRQGIARRIRKYEMKPSRFRKELKILLAEKRAFVRAKELSERVQHYDGIALVAKHVRNIIE